MIITSKIKIILIVILCLPFLRNQTEDDILYGEREIQWDAFKGIPPDDNIITGAITSTSIRIEYGGLPGATPTTKVRCYFVKNKSWTILNDDYSLGHERLHFDISEIFARKIRRSFDSLKVNDIPDLAKYEDVVKSYGKKQKVFNREYDTQVYSNKEQQALWSEKIKSELKSLEKYKYIPIED